MALPALVVLRVLTVAVGALVATPFLLAAMWFLWLLPMGVSLLEGKSLGDHVLWMSVLAHLSAGIGACLGVAWNRYKDLPAASDDRLAWIFRGSRPGRAVMGGLGALALAPVWFWVKWDDLALSVYWLREYWWLYACLGFVGAAVVALRAFCGKPCKRTTRDLTSQRPMPAAALSLNSDALRI